MKLIVKAIGNAAIAEDGSLLQIELAVEGGRRTLEFQAEVFETFLSQAAQLVAAARLRKLTTGDPFDVHAQRAIAATAGCPKGKGAVILSVRADNNLPYHFALTFGQASQLQRDLQAASRKASDS